MTNDPTLVGEPDPQVSHTPGPWTPRPELYGAIWCGPAQLPHPGRETRRAAERLAQRDADARLICAAPDMAAILRDLVAVWDYFEDTGPAPLDGIVARARNLLSGLAGEDGR